MVNYPNGSPNIKNNESMISLKKNKISYGDRGMKLENEINQSNEFYLIKEEAVIHKKPTPIQIVKVDYPKRSAAVIKEAYFQKSSTTDYNGIYKGFYLDFDAKETNNIKSFPLKNFHEHQINHMRMCDNQGGIVFTIIKFVKSNELFLLEFKYLKQFWDRMNNNGKKSISKSELQKYGFQIDYKLNPLIPYLEIIKEIIQKEKLNE
ncbi:Holliday junction resolvase RecU [Lactobacillus sp. S2-2]|uniref:Holliday junction resolvase RecU n=1 Tax=Lactobacillus sp. S2-2 TaxID=2692917 RepID=UPI001F909F46|nr:Holliday junction resolvase RecU [Lactobacillus sp. S2-2]MCF6515068.1 Holliday junction resolvase RecU [Lactobacillus sp. S2-2]